MQIETGMANIVLITALLIQVTMTMIISNGSKDIDYDVWDVESSGKNRTNRASDGQEKSFNQHSLFSDWIKTGTIPSPSPASESGPSMGHPDLPMIISDLNNNFRGASLIDRAITRAPWNSLAAKLFKDLATFFLDSYLVQLFGVQLPI